MKYKLAGSLIACVVFLGMTTQAGTWNGSVDNQWSNALNWAEGSVPDSTGENVIFNANGNNVVLSQSRSTKHLFQNTGTGASHDFYGSALTVNGNLSNFSDNDTSMVFNNQVTFLPAGAKIQTAGLGSIELAGGLVKSGGALELAPNGGSITISGNLDSGGNEIRLQEGTAGTVSLTGTGTWTGGGILRIYNGLLVVARDAADNTGVAADLIQLYGAGTLQLGNNEQIVNTENIGFLENGALFDLNGYTETIKGFATVAAVSGNVAMGVAGALHIANQSESDILYGLLITEWADGEDHIYVDGGSFSVGQLSAITFDGYGAGAQVLGGELIPVAIPEPATLGLLALFGFALFVRRHLSY